MLNNAYVRSLLVRRLIQIICCSLLVALLSGCIGLFVSHSEECTFQPPTLKKYDSSREPVIEEWHKELFISEWGMPNEFLTSDKSEEVWVYKRRQWCGIEPVIILPIPLMLPLCTGYDQITFQGDKAISRQARVIIEDGLFFVFPLLFSVGSTVDLPSPFKGNSCYGGLFANNFIDLTE